MNVIILHQHFKLPAQAGSTRIYSFAKGLAKRNYKVTIITGVSCRASFTRDQSRYKICQSMYKRYSLPEGIDVISINDFYNQKLSFSGRLLSFLSFALLSCLVSLKLQSIQVIFASSTPLSIAIPAISVSKIRKIPFVFEVRDLWPEAPIQLGFLKNRLLIRIARWLERFTYNNAKEIIGISEGICEKIALNSGKIPRFIPHGVDMEFYNGTVGCSEKKRDGLKVIYAGSCGYNNAIEVFLKVSQLFASEEDFHNVNFILVGDGPALEELRGGTWRNVLFLGQLPKTDVVRVLKSADIALFSQRKAAGGNFKKDSLPNKFFDFLGASLPIVAGVEPDGEMEHYLNKYRCGIAVEAENVGDLYDGVKKLIIDGELRKRMSQASQILAREFTKDSQAEKFATIIEKCVAG